MQKTLLLLFHLFITPALTIKCYVHKRGSCQRGILDRPEKKYCWKRIGKSTQDTTYRILQTMIASTSLFQIVVVTRICVALSQELVFDWLG
ncbi:hypothetical protein L596_009914 [Steinernema carpocapsae]|uniref:Secreted protein n=1 Tax=Steinernema carpocapsae TaxID=34508 RepID=A0A4U5PH13_STECR|nr:hypothetical protein L596_009914 [Steinernema carpocapsae]